MMAFPSWAIPNRGKNPQIQPTRICFMAHVAHVNVISDTYTSQPSYYGAPQILERLQLPSGWSNCPASLHLFCWRGCQRERPQGQDCQIHINFQVTMLPAGCDKTPKQCMLCLGKTKVQINFLRSHSTLVCHRPSSSWGQQQAADVRKVESQDQCIQYSHIYSDTPRMESIVSNPWFQQPTEAACRIIRSSTQGGKLVLTLLPMADALKELSKRCSFFWTSPAKPSPTSPASE